MGDAATALQRDAARPPARATVTLTVGYESNRRLQKIAGNCDFDGLGAGGRRTLREVACPAEAFSDLDDESDRFHSGFSLDLLCGAQIYWPEMGPGSRFQKLGYLEALECRLHCSEDRVLYSGLLNRYMRFGKPSARVNQQQCSSAMARLSTCVDTRRSLMPLQRSTSSLKTCCRAPAALG
jgi:hypothetical protein